MVDRPKFGTRAGLRIAAAVAIPFLLLEGGPNILASSHSKGPACGSIGSGNYNPGGNPKDQHAALGVLSSEHAKPSSLIQSHLAVRDVFTATGVKNR